MKFGWATNVFILLLLLLSISLVNFGQVSLTPMPNQNTNPVRVTSIEGITEYRLANGLQVLLFPDQTKQNITVNIVYRVGSRHEGYGETGMAHLLEHLVFKGTPKHPNIPAELTSRGASPNGYTMYDYTFYFETFAASNENLEWALDLESDRMVNSYIAKKDLDSEFSVVRNELESRENDPFLVLFDKLSATAYQWHNYGKVVIGARSDVENVKIENLQAFYKKYYQPDNATLIIGGKFDEAKTLDLIQKKFGVIPKPNRVIDPTWTVEPTQDGERQVTVRRVGGTQFVMAGYHTPAPSHPDFAATAIMSRIINDVPSGRLYKSLVESKKATSLRNFALANKESGYAIYAAELGKNDSIDDAGETLLKTIEDFGKTPPTKEEVERHKAETSKFFENLFNDPTSVAINVGGWVANGDWRLLFLYRERIKKVTPEDVLRVAQKYLIQSNRTSGRFIPTDNPVRAEIPKLTEKEILAMANEVKASEAIATGEAFDPSPLNIQSRTKLGQIGGLKTAFLSKKNRGETVTFGINLSFGDAKSLMNRYFTGNMVGLMLMRGTAKHSRQEIKDQLTRLKAQIFAGNELNGASVIANTTRQNLPEVIKLVAEILQEPSFPQAEFDQLRAGSLTDFESEKSEPRPLAFREMQIAFNKYPKGDVRYNGTLDEDIAAFKSVSLEDVKNYHRDFYGASDGELSIVGDFDEKEITPLLTQLFGNWKSKNPYQRLSNQYFDIPAINKTIETPDKANAVFLARLNLKLKQNNQDYPAFSLGNFILGGGFLNSRLATRIRQKEGISYDISSNLNAEFNEESAVFFVNAIFAPQNAVRLESAIKEELQKVISEGFTADELVQAKQGWLLSRQRTRGQDINLAISWLTYLSIGKTFEWEEELNKKIQSLTVEEVNAAMKKYLTIDKISIVKAGDFAKAKAEKP